ncbi:MAG: hypothetical protein AB7T06_02285 [Kofleriaceae bacterium]
MTKHERGNPGVSPGCEIVAERLALGEPLGEYADHAASCERCRELTSVATKLGASHHAIDPGLGFSARMTVGAQQRIATRRRNRIMTTAGVTAAAAAAFVFVVTRPTDPKPDNHVAIQLEPDKTDPPVAVDDADLKFLVSDPEEVAQTTADWNHITTPLRPYKKLLQGIR